MLEASCLRPKHEASNRHLPANARFLEGPQSEQRHFLRLGETSNACDIESLVWPISPQCLQMLTAVQVPKLDGPINTATCQSAPIGTSLPLKMKGVTGPLVASPYNCDTGGRAM